MRTLLLCAIVVSASACHKKSPPGPQAGSAHHEDRHEPAAPAVFSVVVDIDHGRTSQTWTESDLAALPKIAGNASDGEARETWSLRALVAAKVGGTARVTEVRGETTVPITPADWTDTSKIPVIHTTRRGTLKFRFANPTGKWGPTVVKEVVGLAVTTQPQ